MKKEINNYGSWQYEVKSKKEKKKKGEKSQIPYKMNELLIAPHLSELD